MGYIYIRTHKSYEEYNVCKLGRCTNIIERDEQYSTSELIRGKYVKIFEILDYPVIKLEREIQNHYSSKHVIFDAGTEFYDKSIINDVEKYIGTKGIKYKQIHDLEKIKRTTRTKKCEPRTYQKNIIESCLKYFSVHNSGVLVLPCGVGKTYISLWVAKTIGVNKLIIGVPNMLLVEQWFSNVKKIYDEQIIIKLCSGISIENVKKTIENLEKYTIITTYTSCHKLLGIQFDMKICDECHHLTYTNKKDKSYNNMLNINAFKVLSLTATYKETEELGNIILTKSLSWAINNSIVTDYVVQTITMQNITYDMLELSSICAMKSIADKTTHHLLIYTNTQEHAYKVSEYIIKNTIPDLYVSCYDSSMSKNNREKIVNDFSKSQFGIISCVYCLGEGWDLPLLDGVVIGENMYSDVRIIQACLRPCRKSVTEKNKIAKIIIPMIHKDMTKVKDVLIKLSHEDVNIINKIHPYELCINGTNISSANMVFIENSTLINDIKLCIIRRTEMCVTYETAKQIIKNYENITCKKDYYDKCDVDVRLSKNPEILYRDKFEGWIDYLSIKRMYYDKMTCIKKIQEHNTFNNYLDINKFCEELCITDSNFPPIDLWVDYYNINNVNEMMFGNFARKKQIMYD